MNPYRGEMKNRPEIFVSICSTTIRIKLIFDRKVGVMVVFY